MSVYAPLPEYGGDLPWDIYLYCWWARHEGTSGNYPGSYLTDVQRAIVESALARGDEACAEQHLRDWKYTPTPETQVSKYVPGDHYYVLDRKFDTYWEAVRHAESHGYRVKQGIHEVRMPARDGD